MHDKYAIKAMKPTQQVVVKTLGQSKFHPSISQFQQSVCNSSYHNEILLGEVKNKSFCNFNLKSTHVIWKHFVSYRWCGPHIKYSWMKIKLTSINSTEVTEQPRIYCMILVKVPHYTSISTVKYVSSLRSHVTRDALITKDTPETEDLVKES